MIKRAIFTCALFLSLVSTGFVLAQEQKPPEITSEVPQLYEFHEVIYQIWHEAWPQKNVELLKELIPQIDSGYVKLSRVKLPAILHEKEAKWSEGIKAMGTIIDRYKAAATSGEKEALLKAAEDLHSQYEFLVRTVRPVLKEMDIFHQGLYLLYHYYILEYDLNKITESVNGLAQQMEALNKAELPKKYQSRQEQFNRVRAELSSAVNKVQQLIKTKADKESIVAAIEQMHTNYQKLTAVFE